MIFVRMLMCQCFCWCVKKLQSISFSMLYFARGEICVLCLVILVCMSGVDEDWTVL
jgi:hypothetical protein